MYRKQSFITGLFSSVLVCLLVSISVCGEAEELGLFQDKTRSIPQQWQHRPVGKRDFYFTVPWNIRTVSIQTKNGSKPFEEELWYAEGVLRFERLGYFYFESEHYQSLLKKDNPVIMNSWWRATQSPEYWTPDQEIIDNKAVACLKRIKEDFGERFLGVSKGEWCAHWHFGTRGKEGIKELCEKRHKIPIPLNRDESYRMFELEWKKIWRKLQQNDISLFTFLTTFLNHWECRLGTSITGEEIGGDERCTPMQLAFSRGASRQYNVPWASYIASFAADGETSHMVVRPDERRFRDRYFYGPYRGTSLSVQKRFLCVSYMAGANFIEKEGGSHCFFANYDEETVDKTAPRVLALQDRKTYLSPLGHVYRNFYNQVVKKHKRGIAYTPIALLFDKNHGCVLEYDQNCIVGEVPYTAGDYQTRAIINTLFPWEHRRKEKGTHEANTSVTGPFGDIFDVLTSDVLKQALESYRALILVGDVRLDKQLEKDIKEFVRKGGLLMLVTEQITPMLWEIAGLSDTGEYGEDERGKILSNGTVIREDKKFSYRKVLLNGAKPLVGSCKNPEYPLVTIKEFGKGRIVVATPQWLMPPKSKNKTLNLFSYLLHRIKDELVPVEVHGDVQVLYNRNTNGWVMTLINNDGVYKYPSQKEVVREEEAKEVVLKPRFKWNNADEWLTGKKLSNLSLTVPPGDIRIVELNIKKEKGTSAK